MWSSECKNIVDIVYHCELITSTFPDLRMDTSHELTLLVLWAILTLVHLCGWLREKNILTKLMIIVLYRTPSLTLTSAPDAPGISSAIFLKLIPLVRFIFREWILRMSSRAWIKKQYS